VEHRRREVPGERLGGLDHLLGEVLVLGFSAEFDSAREHGRRGFSVAWRIDVVRERGHRRGISQWLSR
jgi:hypothetical protein